MAQSSVTRCFRLPISRWCKDYVPDPDQCVRRELFLSKFFKGVAEDGGTVAEHADELLGGILHIGILQQVDTALHLLVRGVGIDNRDGFQAVLAHDGTLDDGKQNVPGCPVA